MADRDGRISERDQALVNTLCEAAKSLRHGLHEWTQDEINELVIELELIEVRSDGSLMKEAAQKHLQAVREVDSERLPRSVEEAKRREREIQFGSEPNVFEAMQWLEDTIVRLALVARSVHLIRSAERALAGSLLSEHPSDAFEADDDDWPMP